MLIDQLAIVITKITGIFTSVSEIVQLDTHKHVL